MKYTCFVILMLLASSPVCAQTKLPVIRATAKTVSINDGDYLDKNSWTLSPKARPDVYTADRSRKAKWVTFYTDIDSIRIKVKPGSSFDFVILYNGKDSCYTRVVSAILPESKLENAVATHDTIPFTLTDHDAIAVKAVLNGTDTLNLHFDLSSFDFHLTKDGILKHTHLLSNQPDALAGKIAPNYNKLNKVTTLKMGGAFWTNPPVLTTNFTATGMDGRFGWNLFEGKQVEIDYDRNLIVIHSKLPKIARGYVRSKIEFGRSYPLITGAFVIDRKTYTGNFIMDTGSDQSIILDSVWVARNQFPENLKLIKTIIIHDPRGTGYQTKVVLAPRYSINGFDINNIPTFILSNKSPGDTGINFLGNDVLKRFNIILDLKNDQIYLKPNHLMGVKFRYAS